MCEPAQKEGRMCGGNGKEDFGGSTPSNIRNTVTLITRGEKQKNEKKNFFFEARL
jgi:hypothetical protein